MAEAMPREFYQILHELQAVDFVVNDLVLYLDTHPEDQQALSQFNQFQRRKQTLAQQFEASFGILSGSGAHHTGQRWAWTESPWPWQV
ncbi:spore coat protein CotJB [Alicyclobacillus sp. SO9]|uniref:spore coat protein CotJB n=1 Tax=Alicyclobacillus sp. SO9 TaxID=2665646 RepID=UPI0018E7E494|nr:spore coat protein CotJB [Alicyclobacillus sp. SO9]QQE77620.1 spore coat protein CotJB [Alicyclobacillus sp. SO9]